MMPEFTAIEPGDEVTGYAFFIYEEDAMTYDVLKEFTDPEFKVVDATDGEKKPLHRDAGETFIPAETHYPQHKVDALVLNGTLKLVEKVAPAEKPEKAEKTPAKRK